MLRKRVLVWSVVVEDVGLMLLDGELGSLRVLRVKVMAWSCVGSEGSIREILD